MSREICFRAWDEGSKRMLDHTDIFEGTQDNQFLLGDIWIDDAPGFVLMQCTGHKSIDGSEIYEGDIVSFPGSDHPYVVKWIDDEGCWGVMYSDTLQMGKIGIVQLMEVIGNVYANPELLK